jgi:ribosomal protein S12 methylthiotransferase accessory factor
MSAAPLAVQVERLLDLVSPRVGVIKSVTRVARGADEPSPPIMYHAVLANYDFKKAEGPARVTAGKGLNDSEAIGGAIGEAIERYCASHAAVRRIKRARLGELSGPSISPDELVPFSASQYAREAFAYPRWTEDTVTGWLPARELPMDREVNVPACFVYLNYLGPAGEDSFVTPTSNGLAAGPSLEQATLSGLCELAERDGFLVHWMNRLPAPEVRFDDGLAADIRQHYQRFGIETRVFNLSTDLPIYVMMAVSLGDGEREPAALVGLGAHLNPRTAMTKALFEICQIRPGERRRFIENGAGKNLRQYSDVKTLHDHSAFLMRPERRSELAFLLDHGRQQSLGELPDRSTRQTNRDLDTALSGLAAAGCRVAYVDLTTADVRPFGIRVVRTLATGLQPMHFGHGEERLGGRRLFDLPRTLGYARTRRDESDLNPCPHPLA